VYPALSAGEEEAKATGSEERSIESFDHTKTKNNGKIDNEDNDHDAETDR
jgi:hypothetical protein